MVNHNEAATAADDHGECCGEYDNTSAAPDRLDAMAAELPPEYHGPWIAKLVRSFGGARNLGGDMLDDLFQTACLAATAAIGKAEAKGGDPSAFVKIAVRHALTDAIRRLDSRCGVVVSAEDAMRGEADDPSVRHIEELPQPEYRPSRKRRVDLVRLAALLVSPPAQRFWMAFRRTNGSDAAVARRLGTTQYIVAARIAPRAFAEFVSALGWAATLKGGSL
jgi:DNA-directed RNA polymerase specialized sigma24 family protein